MASKRITNRDIMFLTLTGKQANQIYNDAFEVNKQLYATLTYYEQTRGGVSYPAKIKINKADFLAMMRIISNKNI